MDNFEASSQQAADTLHSTEEFMRWLRDVLHAAQAGDPIALMALREVLQTTQHVRIAGELLSYVPANSGHRITCMMPNNQHFISTWRNFKCTADPKHIFCARHALSHCPICGSTVK